MSAQRVVELCEALKRHEGTPSALLLAVCEVWPKAERENIYEQRDAALASALLTLNEAVAKGVVTLSVSL